MVALPGVIPDSVKLAFGIGAFVFLSSILFTIFTTKEYPPKDLKKFKEQQGRNFKSMLSEFTKHFIEMPLTMKKLGLIQFFSWFAFFTMWSMANPAITEHVFNAPIPIMSDFDLTNKVELSQYNSENLNFQKASNLTGSYMGTYGLSSMLFALILTLYTSKKSNKQKTNTPLVLTCWWNWLYINVFYFKP